MLKQAVLKLSLCLGGQTSVGPAGRCAQHGRQGGWVFTWAGSEFPPAEETSVVSACSVRTLHVLRTQLLSRTQVSPSYSMLPLSKALVFLSLSPPDWWKSHKIG